MKRWEYTREVVRNSVDLRDVMDDHGDEGWEVFHIEYRDGPEWWVFFKREAGFWRRLFHG